MAERAYNGQFESVPKIIGADAELGNLILGAPVGDRGTCREAARALLAEIDGVSAGRRSSRYGERLPEDPPAVPYRGASEAEDPDEMDRGRVFLSTNGASVYIDLDHLEITTPETRSARDHVAAWHAMLRIARDALHRANARLPDGQRIVALVNNSDGKGHSYGSHLSISLSRAAWDDMFVQRMHPSLFFLIAFQASSIVITGQGKVGVENGWSRIAYQISQRADFFMQITGPETSYRRPLANSRDESHCTAHFDAASREILVPGARLHCIFHDQTLCHVATFLKAGLMQLVVAMIEAGRVDRGLVLRSPLNAVRKWSRDPSLCARAALDDGREVTAVELQRLYLERAREFAASGDCAGVVPEAPAILDLWSDTLDRLERRDFDVLSRRLDWVGKRRLLERAMDDSRGLDWDSPEIAYLDQMYGSLDDAEGLYWSCERAGAVDFLLSDYAIEHFVHEPPSDTRAWARAMLLRSYPANDIDEIDWSFVRLRHRSSCDNDSTCTVWLPAPHLCGRPEHTSPAVDVLRNPESGGRHGATRATHDAQ
jgi:proteasome accessory factor A